MSQWRLIVKALSDGPATRAQLQGAVGFYPEYGCRRARLMGMVETERHKWSTYWRLTPRGVDFIEGRLTLVEAEGGIGRPAHRLAATWLASLPRATA